MAKSSLVAKPSSLVSIRTNRSSTDMVAVVNSVSLKSKYIFMSRID